MKDIDFGNLVEYKKLRIMDIHLHCHIRTWPLRILHWQYCDFVSDLCTKASRVDWLGSSPNKRSSNGNVTNSIVRIKINASIVPRKDA